MENAIVVTGAAGFIGSCMAQHLFRKGVANLVLVDDFSKTEKHANLVRLDSCIRIDRAAFLSQLDDHQYKAIIHLGARTDTTEFDQSIFNELNLEYSKAIWQHCVQHSIPLIYASSAATYGDGSLGFDDDMAKMHELEPLNPYGQSKLDFDLWASAQEEKPPFWCGLKFFNVFGPNEYHKGRMASVVFHTFNQIQNTGKMKLFQSHNPNYADGGQIRDFIYVKDVISVIDFWLEQQPTSGVFNLGTGTPRTFNDLATATFRALGLEPKIEYIPTPEDIRDKYQYFTKASMERSLHAGYTKRFLSLEESVSDYVINHLSTNTYY
ncbi:MAG: ADP-glyceromanno-heptose 6-epimerase [Bacteroidia bacterium]|nr:ADP-glyceromanno-heptose 6-epimerase [Bacteroidia bacterium]